MAIIYSYPDKSSPSLSDKIVITDVESTPANQTKRCTIQNLADAISGQFTLQEVLQAGSSAIGETGGAWSGNMSLQSSANTVLPQIKRRFIVDVNGLTGSGNDKTAYLVGNLQVASNGAADAGDIDAAGSLDLGGSATVGTSLTVATTSTLNGKTTIGSVASITGNPDLKVGNSIKFGGGIGSGSAFTIGSGYDGLGTNPSDFTGPSIQFASSALSILNKGTGAITIGRATTPASSGVINIGDGNTTQLRLESTDTGGNVDIEASDGIAINNTTTGDIEITNSAVGSIVLSTPSGGITLSDRTTASDYVDFQADNGIRLNGVSGSAGQLIQSKGSGAPLEWINSSDLSVGRIIEDVQFSSAVIKGTAVYISGPAHGSGRPTVDIADADGASTKMPVIGLALQDYAAGQGQVIVTGVLDDIDLTTHGSFSVGDVLYIKDQGGSPLNTNLQNTKPTGDAKIQNIGIIAKPGANGSIQVSCIGRTNDLPNNDANALFSANANGLPVSTTGKFEVDIANDIIKIGDSALTTDVTITSDNFRGEIKNDTAAGIENLQIGYQSLQQAMDNGGTARSNVAIGVRSMQGLPVAGVAGGSYNVAVGNDTLNSNQNLFANVTGNVAIGHQALQGGPTNIADYNTAIGYQSLINLAGVAAGTADNNTAVGAFSLFNVTSGGENTAIGVGSGQAITGGSNNTFLGHNSGTTTGTIANATAIGQNADVQGINGTALGQDSSVVGNNSVALGKGATAVGPGVVNINVSGVNGPTAVGGLFITNSTALPPGLQPGDVYVLDAAAPNNATGHNLLCIHP